MNHLFYDPRSLASRRRFWPCILLAGAAALAVLLALPSPAAAQFDFADARTVKFTTYPVKRDEGKPVAGPDGMPQPKAIRGGRPVGLTELPSFLIRDDAPGAWMLDALQHYIKRDPIAGLAVLLAILENRYLELEVEKLCSRDTIKISYEHLPTEEVPAFKEAGLSSLMTLLADALRANDLQREYLGIRDRYNAGLTLTPKADQETIERLRGFRFGIALRYNPRVVHPALEDLPPPIAKELFKAAAAKGQPLETNLVIGPLYLAMLVKVDRIEMRPPPAGCPGAKGVSRPPAERKPSSHVDDEGGQETGTFQAVTRVRETLLPWPHGAFMLR